MNTILLVDDDDYVLDGLLRHIPWQDIGVRIIGTAGDGEEGLRKYRELKPDIVITDIYMPEMDGFQLTEAIHAIDESVPIVILSGYDDFANARKAMSSGIQHFLLKPPSLAEIEFVVREVVQQLNESRERDELLSSYFRQQGIVRRTMREAFARDLLTTRYRPEELPGQRIAFMGLPDNAVVQALTLSLVRSNSSSARDEREWQLLRFGTGNIVRELLETRLESQPGLSALALEYTDTDFVVVFLGDMEESNYPLPFLTKLSEELVGHILQYMKLSVLAGLGLAKNGYHRLIDSYLESLQAVEKAEMNEWNRVYAYSESAVPEPERNVPLEAVRNLHDSIFQKRWQQVEGQWKRLAGDLACGGFPLPVLTGICAGIMSAMWTASSLADSSKLGSEEEGLEAHLLRLSRCGSSSMLLERMDDAMSRMLDRGQEELHGKKSHALVDRVIREFIEKGYDQEITLEQIAASLHVNRNYLSQLFKKVTGEPFVTYFNKYRIQKAKELIRTGKYMVYEISEMVGFRNSTYFSQVFKSITGYSPSEFER